MHDCLESVDSRIVYELYYRKLILDVILMQSILGKLAVIPVSDGGTYLRNFFPGAPGDRKPGAGNGCRRWFVHSWASEWSCDM